MKIAHIDYQIDLDIIENEINIIVLEEPRIFSLFVYEMYNQTITGNGKFVLSEKEQYLKFKQDVLIILEPFSINMNDKKITTKLYQEIYQEIIDTLVEATTNIKAELIEYIEKAVASVPYATTYDLDLNVLDLLKTFNVGIETDANTLIERLCEYIRIVTQLCGYKLIVFINLKTYLSEEELLELYQVAFYNKIHLLLIENRVYGKIDVENTLVIDKDLCVFNA